MFSLDDYDYELPPERIAQTPADRRDGSRLMRLDRRTGALAHHRFDALAERLEPGDALVVNDTAVVPARLLGRKDSGGRVEVFLIDYAGGTRSAGGGFACECLIKSSKPTRVGVRIRFEGGLTGTVVRAEGGSFRVEFAADGDFDAVLDRVGHVPLPPYIRRPDRAADRSTYQTVYAAVRGAVAAPTAGLHFTPELIARLRGRGVRVLPITLHVGYGTFAPVRVADIRAHRMHAERFAIPAATAEGIAAARAGRRPGRGGRHDGRAHPGTRRGRRRARPGGRRQLRALHPPRIPLQDRGRHGHQLPPASIDPDHAGGRLRRPRAGARGLP